MVVCKCRKDGIVVVESEYGLLPFSLIEFRMSYIKLDQQKGFYYATKLYCFVHKVPVCGECICFPEHQLCVIRTYSEWVIDGEYDWPPKCCHCQAVLEGTDPQTTRLGCLHIIHTSCLVSHIKSFPPHTAPAGYVCPECSTSIWPPKSVKDSGSRLHSKLKAAIMQIGLEKNLFGNHLVSFPGPESRSPPPAFASDPLMHADAGGMSSSVGIDAASITTSAKPSTLDIIEINGPDSATSSLLNHELNLSKSSSPSVPGATTRKSALQFERQSSEVSYYADDEDGNQKKYSRRGTFRHKLLRSLVPFWSSALPTLPVTAPPRKDASNADDIPEGRPRHHRSSKMDPRKLLLILAIMACMATMGILYYRLAQRGLSDELPTDEKQ